MTHYRFDYLGIPLIILNFRLTRGVTRSAPPNPIFIASYSIAYSPNQRHKKRYVLLYDQAVY